MSIALLQHIYSAIAHSHTCCCRGGATIYLSRAPFEGAVEPAALADIGAPDAGRDPLGFNRLYVYFTVAGFVGVLLGSAASAVLRGYVALGLGAEAR